MFFKIGVPKNVPKFTGKHLCQSLFFKKDAGLRPIISLKRLFLWISFFRTPPVAASLISVYILAISYYRLQEIHIFHTVAVDEANYFVNHTMI